MQNDATQNTDIPQQVTTTDDTICVTQAQTAPVPCTERAWCTLTDPQEHAEYHGGASVPLAYYDAASDSGWSCHIVEERGGRPVLGFEGHIPDVDFHHSFAIDAALALSLLWAVETPEAMAALREVLDQIAGGGRS